MKYSNGIFTGTYHQCMDFLKSSIPRDHPENWPQGPWVIIDKQSPMTLDQRRERQRRVLKIERIRRVSEPINNIQVATLDDRDSAKWSASNVESIEWIMADNTVQLLKAAELNAAITEYPLRKMRLFEIYTGLMRQLSETDDPESVIWPE